MTTSAHILPIFGFFTSSYLILTLRYAHESLDGHQSLSTSVNIISSCVRERDSAFVVYWIFNLFIVGVANKKKQLFLRCVM
jgi:hypothetical protein